MRRYSASQLTNFKGCPRRWWFQYVAGHRSPPTESQRTGTAIHGAIEKYLLDGELPSDRRAIAGIEALASREVFARPVAGSLHIEGGITIPLDPAADGTPRSFVGFIDLRDDSNPQRPVITDHKTSSDLKYAKTVYELAEDVQLLSYAKWALDNEPTADEVTLRHNVILTRGRALAQITAVTVDRHHVESRWKSYLPILAEMDSAHGITNAADVEAKGLTSGECEKFGGCVHRSRCAAAIFRTETISSDVGAPADGKGKGKEQDMATIHEKLAAIKARATPATPTQEPAAVEPSKSTSPLATSGARAVLDGPAAPTPGDSAKAKLEALRARVAPKRTEEPKKEAPAFVLSPEAKSVIEAASVADAKADAAAEVVEVRTVAELPVQLAASGGVEAKAGKRARFLFLNCSPVTGLSATPVESFLAPVLDAIRQETGKGWQMHQFREGAGLVCEGIERAAAAGLIPDALAVDTTTPLGKVALEGLMHRADIVVTGRAA